ncbi:hypothetical protein PRK78_001554 [Emydomyces testavorans]|uniref:Translation initiation factor eIF-2B subunit family protein n=1 Tax=Emydomyces testavorans TaxID=2070801 RepID=A0AAF0DDI2_9EURO|nr:hypothetical protein PRK78_001554 [Emydomyces testavorans]
MAVLRLHSLKISFLYPFTTISRTMSTKPQVHSRGAPYLDLSDLPPIPLADRHRLTEKWHTEAQQTLLEGIRELRNDHTSGAKILATKAVASLVQIAKIIDAGLAEARPAAVREDECKDKLQIWWDAVRRAGWALATHGRPSMDAAITVAVLNALEQGKVGSLDTSHGAGQQPAEGVATTVTPHGNELITYRLQNMEEYLRRRADAGQTQIGQHLRQFIRDKCLSGTAESEQHKVTILTLSLSSTIKDALTTMLALENSPSNRGKGAKLMVHLHILESRPMFEGAELTRILTAQAVSKGYADNLKIELASDASVAILARDVDIVLIGADRISESGDVSNKTGSLPAILVAKHLSKNAIAVALSDIEKVARPGAMEEHLEEDNDPTELSRAWSAQVRECASRETWKEMVRVRNVYFEWVPANYIDRYICETGVLSLAEIKKQSEWVLSAEQRLFGEDVQHGRTHPV